MQCHHIMHRDGHSSCDKLVNQQLYIPALNSPIVHSPSGLQLLALNYLESYCGHVGTMSEVPTGNGQTPQQWPTALGSIGQHSTLSVANITYTVRHYGRKLIHNTKWKGNMATTTVQCHELASYLCPMTSLHFRAAGSLFLAVLHKCQWKERKCIMMLTANASSPRCSKWRGLHSAEEDGSS